ncbi:MAG TPA: peptidoglycan bridge formation glycyltransferase FemA/FemB family protein [Candidatus Saccharibacteria bacterium]|nr:peptidoglycan bridge formation glycyltransferase FemA/FemB family protein [Candidatus Saccharibacteria bacterium]
MPVTVKLYEQDQGDYDTFLTQPELKPHLSFMHTWEWGEVMKSESRACLRLGIYRENKLIGLAQVQQKPLRVGGYFWYCPRGIAMDYSDHGTVTKVYRAVSRFMRKKGGAFFRVDPDIVRGDTLEKAIDKLHPAKAAIFSQAERVWCVDIQKTDEEQLAWMKEHGMRKNIPYYLRRSARAGVAVIASDRQNDLERLITMLQNLRDRKNMVGGHDDHLRRQFAALGPRGYEKVFFAKKSGHALAGALVAIYGKEASYLHGASLDLFRELQAPHSLHFEIMRYLAKYYPEVERYNFWGIVSDKNRNPSHPRHGYSEFKRSFGGYKEEYIRARDFIYNPIAWRLDWFLQKYWAWKYKND